MDSVTSVLNPELDKLAISVVAKEEFRKEIGGMVERSKAYRKKQMAELQKRAIPETAQMGAEAAEKGEKALVMRFDYGNDAKLMRDMGDNLSAKGKHCAMVFSADLDGETMACYAVVSDEAAAAGINATDWVNAALAPMGGKGGGKGPVHNRFDSLFSETYTDRRHLTEVLYKSLCLCNQPLSPTTLQGSSALGKAKTLDNTDAALKAAEKFISGFKSS